MYTILSEVKNPQRWSPFDQLFSLRNELNRLMEIPFAEANRSSELFNGWIPALDMFEDKDNITVRAELPGMKKEAIQISLHEGALTISGERPRDEEFNDAETFRSERLCGRFHRAVTLPKPVVPEKVKATYNNGILTVTLPKAEEAKPRQIAVSLG